MITNKIILQILEKYETIWALGYLNKLSSWDLETYMPTSGAMPKGKAMAKLGSLSQQLFLKKDFVSLIQQARKEKKLNDAELGIVRLLSKELQQYQKLPKKFIETWQQVTNKSQVAWREAREKNDYNHFSPYLQKIVDLNIQKAEYLGYKNTAFDALLDEFEEGMTTAQLDAYFDSIRTFLQNLIRKVQKSPKYQKEHPLSLQKYNQPELEKLNQDILKAFNFDPKTLRLDISSHPFTQSMAIQDVRITTAYPGQDFAFTLGATIHEYGHALYELQIDQSLEGSPIGEGTSLGIHESQSRFWENFIFRSKSFIKQIYPQIQKLHPQIAKYSIDDIYQYFNNVTPGLIRIEADELTYHFHVMIRYEIEKALISRELSVEDLPQAWNAKYKEYLGITPPNDAKGVLQDIHWSMGAIGYFPTYSTGTVLSATWKYHLEKELGDLDQLISSPHGYQKIQYWLKDNIHQYGSTYSFNDLVMKKTDEAFTTTHWLKYLKEKYTEIYQLEK